VATPKTVSGIEPLTKDEQNQLKALQAKQAAVDAAASAQAQADQLAKLVTLQTLVDLIGTDEVAKAVIAAAMDESLGFDVLERTRRFRQMYEFDIVPLRQMIENLRNPPETQTVTE